MFKANDLVYIHKQPENLFISVRGLSGYIEEIVGDYAQFVELREIGHSGSCGGIPLNCLTIKNDDETLIRLKAEKDAYLDRILKEAVERGKRFDKLKEKFMNKAINETGVSKENIIKIFEIANKFYMEL